MITAVVITWSILACLWAPLQYPLAVLVAVALIRLVCVRPLIPFPVYTLSAALWLFAVSYVTENVAWTIASALWLLAVAHCPWGGVDDERCDPS